MAWADTKRLIAQIVGPRLAALGFVNPGRAMWRFRPAFVDVVWFECRRSWRFQLEFACGLRGWLPNNPAPWDCPFRVSPAHTFGWPDGWWAFQGRRCQACRLLPEE
ncbi:MAG: hypothetical protein U0793_15380 [Gemmataceae bacterium]